MLSISQKHKLGCGAACLAFVVGCPYNEIIEIISINKANKTGLICKELVCLLSKYGLQYEYTFIKPRLRREIYKNGTIVFLKRSKKYPSGHYMTRTNGLWMDPWINFSINSNLNEAISGFRVRLPYKPSYALLPIN